MLKVNKKFIDNFINNTQAFLQRMTNEELITLLQTANQKYYNSGLPLFSDDVYDELKEFIAKKLPYHPILKHIGCSVADDAINKVILPYELASLDKIKNDDHNSLTAWLKKHPGTYVISDKLDGVSCLLCRKSGEQNVCMYTRGDGHVGQNISHLVNFVRDIPPNLCSSIEGGDIAVRGELIISKHDFSCYLANKCANARNTVSGLVNAKLPDLYVAEFVHFIAYELIIPSGLKPSEAFQVMSSMGFTTAFHQVCASIEDKVLSPTLIERRAEGEYDVDGIVVAHDEFHARKPGNPTYAFAYKSVKTFDTAEAVVSHVEWNVSKDGYIKPTIVFPAVNLAGVIIKRATGFNAKYVHENVIGPGSKIIVYRSGDVIPYVSKVVSPAKTGESQLPDREAFDYEWTSSGVDIKVKGNHTKNDDVILKNLEFFVKTVDVRGLSLGNLRKMFDAGFKTVKSILHARKEELTKVPGFQDKLSDKIIESISEARNRLTHLLVMTASNAFGRGIGMKKLQIILNAIPAITSSERKIPSVHELVAIKGIEDATARQFVNNIDTYWNFVKDNDITIVDNVPCLNDATTPCQPLTNFIVVFSGFRDEAMERTIIDLGGSVTSAVSKNTTVVITKDVTAKSTKLEKARALNIRILTPYDFLSEFVHVHVLK